MPRVRILHRGLQIQGVELLYCHWNIWAGVRDKSQISGLAAKLVIALKWLIAMPLLSLRYLFMPRHDLVLVSYPGQFDMPFIRLLTRLRRVPLVWDAFLSLWDTAILDRKIARETSITAKALFRADKLAAHMAGHTILDTNAHARFFKQSFQLEEGSVSAVPVGAEEAAFPLAPFTEHTADRSLEVLFYGQLIPLHGLQTILNAVRMLQGENIHFTIIGDGQERILMEQAVRDEALAPTLTWKPWVSYDRLQHYIAASDLCLGIFSAGDKASRVIPNKVYQTLITGRPIISRDSPAIHELPRTILQRITLVPPEDPAALASAISACVMAPALPAFSTEEREALVETAIGRRALTVLTKLRNDHGGPHD